VFGGWGREGVQEGEREGEREGVRVRVRVRGERSEPTGVIFHHPRRWVR